MTRAPSSKTRCQKRLWKPSSLPHPPVHGAKQCASPAGLSKRTQLRAFMAREPKAAATPGRGRSRARGTFSNTRLGLIETGNSESGVLIWRIGFPFAAGCESPTSSWLRAMVTPAARSSRTISKSGVAYPDGKPVFGLTIRRSGAE
eukprot:scaffold116389_cov36-Tisochrysis_lutea.AAC.3